MRHLKISATFLLASALAAAAQLSTNWVAFNDYTPSVLTAPNVTGYTNRLTGDGGLLTNFFTGEELPAAIMVESIGTPDDFGANSYPNAGTPSYNLFNSVIDMGNMGLPGVRPAGAATVTLIFTNLDPGQRYVFRGTVSRGNNYMHRWSFFTIRAPGFTDAHVDGSLNTNIFTAETFPAAAGSLTDGQVALNTGENRDGSMVGWDDIVPDQNGVIAISAERYMGPTPFGDTSDPGTAYAYGINAWMLAEISTGPPAAPAIVAEPANVAVTEQQTAVLRVTATGTGPLRYQWYRGTPPGGTPVGGATRSTFRVINTTGSGAAWSLPEDSGQYYVVVSGALTPPATSRAATVTVTADTTPPAFSYAACTTNVNEIVVSLMEPIENSAGEGFPVTDPLNWLVQAVGGGAIGTLSVTYADGSTNVYLTTTARDPGAGYRIVTAADFRDRALARNVLPTGSSVGAVCFDTELVSLNAEWLLNDADVDPGPTWMQDEFDDGGLEWRRGPGPFDAKRRTIETDPDCRATALHNLGAVGTCLNLTSPVTQTNLIVAYFRTRFQFAGDPRNTILRLNGKLDDGGVVYLNGTELTRIGMPNPPAVIGHTTFSPRGVGDADPQDDLALYYPRPLRVGENVLAVSLHQVNLTSSDLTMGLRLSSARVQAPVLNISYASPNVTITWAPASGILQFKDDITGAWQDVAPQPAAGGPYRVSAVAAARFYRLR